MNKITSEDLIRYIYNETSEKKSAIIRAALRSDWNLKERYEQLLKSHKDLNTIHFSPREQSVNKILEYASKRPVSVS